MTESERDALINETLPLIKHIAHRVATRLPANIEMRDLINAGVLGLLDAIEKFEPERGVKFKTYAEVRIRGAILDSLRNRIRPIFMTTLGGLAGLLPLVIAPGAGSELYRGIGAVLLGGMIVSTFITLMFVPALLSLMLEMQQGLSRFLGFSRREQPSVQFRFDLTCF